MDRFRGLFDVAYAAKAWVSGVVFAGTQLVAGVKLAAADQAISFTEAQGLWLLGIEFLGAVAVIGSVFATRNARAPS